MSADLVALETRETTDGSVPRRATELPRRRLWLVVAALLTTYAVMAFTASLSKGVSFDEGLQLAVGYNIWLNDDYRLEGANGDLVKRWATLPYLFSEPAFVGRDDPLWKGGRAYDLGRRFLFELGNRPESLLAQSRAMITVLGVAAALLVFWCSRELFGMRGGLISLALFTFSPAMLAFGGIVSTDMSITLTLFATTWFAWRLLHVVTLGRLLASLVAAALMVLAKPTALVIFPIIVVLIAVKLGVGQPVVVRWRNVTRSIMTRRGQAAVIAALMLLHVIAGWTAIWTHYGFRYTASPQPDDPALVIAKLPARDAVPASLTRLLGFFERTRILPEGYRVGIDSLLACDDGLGAFMRGQWKIGGWPSFFPYAIWVKTHPTLFFLLLCGGVAWCRISGVLPRQNSVPPEKRGFYAATPFLALIVCYLGIAMTEDFNIGHRHILPIYPALHVLAGAASLLWRKRARWPKLGVLLSLGWVAGDSLVIRPHYIAYFAPQAGGAANGYKHLVDSSLDWGMSLPSLKEWLAEHDPGQRTPLFLAYFGTDSPSYYGIKSTRLPGFLERRGFARYPLGPGYYAISASLFQGVYTAAFGPWSKDYEELYRTTMRNTMAFDDTASDPIRRAELLKQAPLESWENDFDLFDNLRFARLCAWLRHQGDPPHRAGHAIFIWKLDYDALQAALLGPPVELVDEPATLRQFRAVNVVSQ